MKKLLKIALIVVPLLIVIVLLVVYLSLNSIVRQGVQTVLPVVTGTPVEIASVNLFSLFSGKGQIKGLVIKNPEGFNTDHALAFDTIRVDVNVRSVFTDRIIIEEIYIKAPQVVYEVGLGNSNITTIRDNIEKFCKLEEQRPAEEQGKRIQINRFVVEDGTVALSAKLFQGRKLTLPLPGIEQKDIGKEQKGLTVGKVVSLLFYPFETLIKKTVQTSGKLLAGGEKVLNKGLDAAEKGLGKGVKGVEKGAKKAVDAVKDLLD